MKPKLLLTTCLIVGGMPLFGQTLANQVWHAFCASPDTIDIVQTTLDPTGRVVMTGNTKTTLQQNNAWTVVRNTDGTTAWSQSFNGTSNGSDYGTCVTADASGNIYVGGATYSSTTSSYDYLILKYSSTGSLIWSRSYNGPGNGYDVVAGISVKPSGDVIVTGASKGTGNFANLDYATVAFSSTGTQQWVSRYNYLGLPDIPCGLAIDGSGNIFVAGGSANSITGADIFVVKYNASGTQTASYRHTVSSGNGWDKATALALDASGNVYVTGCVYQNNSTSDMRTIKLSNSLALQWQGTYNGDSKDDCANSIALDASGNTIVTGWTSKVAGGKDFTTVKYDASGNQLWARRQAATVSWNNGESRKVKIDNAGNIFIAGEMDHNGNKDFLAIRYDANGNKQWEEFFNGTANGADRAYDLNLSGSAIYVSGKTATASGDQYGTVKYETMTTQVTPGVFQGNQYVSGEVTVRFAPDPTVLNYSAVDNKDLQFGIVADFVSSATIQNMNAKLGTDVTKWKMAKIFYTLKTTDTISISRLGEHVQVPSFWSAFRIFPEGIADTVVMDSLNKITPDIWYAEVTPVIDMLASANDALYATDQASLHPTATYPNANINVEPAWDIETGEPFVRLGIFDSGIDQSHDELNNGKVAGGYDYYTNASLASPYDGFGHGTACASVAGGYRNNSTGIAGVAGGDGTAGNPGVSLYDLRIFGNNGSFASLNLAAQSFVDGAKSQSIGGMELQIMSCSWKSTSYQLLQEAVRFAHDNDVVIVAARGNDGNTTATFPSCYYDPQVISVGSTSIDGNYQNAQAGSDPYSSSYQQVDIAAPGTSQIIRAADTQTNGYRTFNGTSAATPHVSGTAALMLSSYNSPSATYTNLAPEDVEQIMKRTATDVTALPCAPGFDQYTGAGRLDAGAALNGLQPGYRIHHYADAVNVQSYSIVPVQLTNTAVIVNSFNQAGVPAGTYWAETYKVTHTFTINDIGPNETIIGAWARPSSTLGISASNPMSMDMYCNLISYSATQIVIETYVYHFYQHYPVGNSVSYWIPTSLPANTKVAATIYTYDPTFVGVQEQTVDDGTFNLFPNPATDAVNVDFLLDGAQKVKIEMFDVAGRVVDAEEEERYSEGRHTVALSTANLAEGLYIVRMTTENGVVQKKVLVQHSSH